MLLSFIAFILLSFYFLSVSHLLTIHPTEVATGGVLQEKVFLEISQIAQNNTNLKDTQHMTTSVKCHCQHHILIK